MSLAKGRYKFVVVVIVINQGVSSVMCTYLGLTTLDLHLSRHFLDGCDRHVYPIRPTAMDTTAVVL